MNQNKRIIQIANLNHYSNDQMNRVYSILGISPTIMVVSGGGRKIKILIKTNTKKGFETAETGDSINFEQPNSKTRRGRVGHGVAQTITTSPQQAVVEEVRVRDLTEREYFRLMDFDDADFEKAAAVNSNTQLYKQAGNSIVVAVPYYIIKALIEANIFIEKEKKEMELKINGMQLPGPISFNYEELKQEIAEKVSMYTTLVYTDEQIQEAKKDKAALNKLKKALNDERIRMEKEYMVPFNTFKAQINEIIGIIDKPVNLIDQQVKGYEEKQKQEKLEKIQEYYNSIEKPELHWVGLPAIYCEKWLNASVSMKSIQGEIDARLEQIENDLVTLSGLPEFGFEATETYKSTLDINKALNEGRRLSEIAKAKAAHEAEMKARAEEQARLTAEAESKKQEEPEEQPLPFMPDEEDGFIPDFSKPEKEWYTFTLLMGKDDWNALQEFFIARNIEYKSF